MVKDLKSKYIFTFAELQDFKNSSISLNKFGNKAVNLGKLYGAAYKVPHGFVISSDLVNYKIDHGTYPENFYNELKEHIEKLEIITEKKLENPISPLFLSVRSSGSISMPGILDTMLNIGINETLLHNLHFPFAFSEDIYNKNPLKEEGNIFNQIKLAIQKVVESLHGEKINKYFYGEKHNVNMGIIVQEMVFGNRNENSYTGVVFSSHPSNGSGELFGEFLSQHQGDELVNGKVTPENIDKLKILNENIYNELFVISKSLEKKFKYIQDLEFTVENNQLFILQTRNGELPLGGKILMLERFLKEEIISCKEFFNEIKMVNNITNSFIDYEKNDYLQILSIGLGAAGNVVVGFIATTYKQALALKRENKNVIFCAVETNSNDIDALNIASGLITMRGGATSHAAVVARGKNITCVLSVKNMNVYENGVEWAERFFPSGSSITLDGNNGFIIDGEAKIEKENSNYDFLNWRLTPIDIRINGETPEDMVNGHKFHMNGVGLCRIEHMLLKQPGLQYIRNLILDNTYQHQNILEEYLTEELYLIFQNLKGLPINIRLIDPPLHEFLPNDSETETNPMMGNRGARILITYDKLCELQVRAIFISNFYKMTSPPSLEIMVPFVFDVKELIYIKNIIKKVADDLQVRFEKKITYKIGVMVELPRAVFVAHELATEVDFISFGTNDLTQMTFGLSRDDSQTIIDEYMKKGILLDNPFITLDKVIKEMITMCMNKSKIANPEIYFAICGEHAGEEKSIEFLSKLPFKYISCSPFRVQEAAFFLNKYFICRDENI
jgi:pyruvate,orthophosphate dikinase